MSDVYAYWRAHIAGGKTVNELDRLMLPTIGATIPGENPQAGLYKVRLAKGEPYVLLQVWLTDAETGDAARVWRDGLTIAGMIGKAVADERAIVDRWLFALPVSKDDAAYWREHGQWPGDAPALPSRTHNQPTDPYAFILGEAHERIEQAKSRLDKPITDQTGCNMARNLQAEILALSKRADAMHEAEKRPHLEASRAVDRRYDFRATLIEWAGKLRDTFGQWMAAEEARQRAELDRIHKEQLTAAEAERARIAAERAQLMEDDPIAALTSPELQLPPLPAAPMLPKVQSGGGTGRKAGLKNDWDVEIVDYRLAALQVIDDADVAIQVEKAIKRRVKAAKGNIDIPGCKITTVRRVA